MIVPAVVYSRSRGEAMRPHGFGIAMPTDIVFVLAVVALVAGRCRRG